MTRSRATKAAPTSMCRWRTRSSNSVALESTRTIDIDMFVPRDSIGWIWYDRPHYLVPDDPVGEEAFSVIRDAMEATDMVGISRLVLYRRERAVMLEPRDGHRPVDLAIWRRGARPGGVFRRPQRRVRSIRS